MDIKKEVRRGKRLVSMFLMDDSCFSLVDMFVLLLQCMVHALMYMCGYMD